MSKGWSPTVVNNSSLKFFESVLVLGQKLITKINVEAQTNNTVIIARIAKIAEHSVIRCDRSLYNTSIEIAEINVARSSMRPSISSTGWWWLG